MVGGFQRASEKHILIRMKSMALAAIEICFYPGGALCDARYLVRWASWVSLLLQRECYWWRLGSHTCVCLVGLAVFVVSQLRLGISVTCKCTSKTGYIPAALLWQERTTVCLAVQFCAGTEGQEPQGTLKAE